MAKDRVANPFEDTTRMSPAPGPQGGETNATAYLVVLGVRLLRRPAGPLHVPAELHAAVRPLRLFGQGFAVQIANPKAVMFFSALLPQFLSPAAGLAPQLVILGVTSLVIELVVLLAYGLAAERGTRILPTRVQARLAGVALIAAGVGLSALRHP